MKNLMSIKKERIDSFHLFISWPKSQIYIYINDNIF